MIDLFSKVELKSDDEIEKAKKVIEMQVAKEMHELKKNQPEEEESNEVEDADSFLSNRGYYPGQYSSNSDELRSIPKKGYTLDKNDPFKTYDEWRKW